MNLSSDEIQEISEFMTLFIYENSEKFMKRNELNILAGFGSPPIQAGEMEKQMIGLELLALVYSCAFQIVADELNYRAGTFSVLSQFSKYVAHERVRRCPNDKVEDVQKYFEERLSKYVSIADEFSGSKRASRLIAEFLTWTACIYIKQPTDEQVNKCFREIADFLLVCEKSLRVGVREICTSH